MRNLLIGLLLAAALVRAVGAQAGVWTENYDQAMKDARELSRFVLLDFTGSDWCGWCKKLDAEVFSQNAFQSYAQQNLICVTIDFPRDRALPFATQRQNEQLKNRFGIRGFPTLILLDPDGKQVADTGYRPGGADSYVHHLKGLIAPHSGKFSRPKPRAITSLKITSLYELRKWTSLKAGMLDARLESRTADKVKVRREDGTVLELEIPFLSDEDQQYLSSIQVP
jgi:protein disulfide-isomerase